VKRGKGVPRPGIGGLIKAGVDRARGRRSRPTRTGTDGEVYHGYTYGALENYWFAANEQLPERLQGVGVFQANLDQYHAPQGQIYAAPQRTSSSLSREAHEIEYQQARANWVQKRASKAFGKLKAPKGGWSKNGKTQKMAELTQEAQEAWDNWQFDQAQASSSGAMDQMGGGQRPPSPGGGGGGGMIPGQVMVQTEPAFG
jgi:hypothetical protein